jgi:hypothetical protein
MVKAVIGKACAIATIFPSPVQAQNQSTTYFLGKIEMSRDISGVENDAFNASLAQPLKQGEQITAAVAGDKSGSWSVVMHTFVSGRGSLSKTALNPDCT